MRGSFATSYRRDMRVWDRKRIAATIVFVALLLYLPTVLLDLEFLFYNFTPEQLLGIGLGQVNFALVAVMGAIALNLLVGSTGLLSLGHAAFFAVGAMVAGQVGTKWGAPFPVVILAAGLGGALVGAIVALPSLRLRGLYLLLSTLALHFIVIYLFLRYQVDQFGPAGIPFDPPTLFGITFDSDTKWYFLLLAFAAVTILVTSNLLRSREGRAFVAVRDHDIAAGATGVNVAAVKFKAFALSSFIVSVAGALYAYYLANATAEIYTLGFVIDFYAMIIIGGMGSPLGAVLGALLWQLLPQAIETISGEVGTTAPVVGTLFSDYQEQTVSILLGALIILILIFKPDGLNGMWLSTKRAVTRWPYTT